MNKDPKNGAFFLSRGHTHEQVYTTDIGISGRTERRGEACSHAPAGGSHVRSFSVRYGLVYDKGPHFSHLAPDPVVPAGHCTHGLVFV